MPSLAGAGRVSGLHCCRTAHGGDWPRQLCFCAHRDYTGGGRAGGRISAAFESGHAAIAALWGHAALFAGRGPGARHYRDLSVGQPGQLVRELGADLRQVWNARAGGEWIGDFDRLRAHHNGGCLLGFAWRYERGRGHPLFRHWAGVQAARLQRLLRWGLPAAGQILLEVGAWNLATFLAGYLTPVALATHQIVLNYASVTYMVPLGISAAAAVSVGHAVGAGDTARARRAGWLALGLGTGFMLLAAVAFLAWPRPLIALFTRDARVLAVGPGLLGIVAAFEVFDGIQTVSTGALRGLGETRAPMLANLVGYWALGLPLGFLLCFALKWGIYGLWIGLTLALVVIALAVLARWRQDSAHAWLVHENKMLAKSGCAGCGKIIRSREMERATTSSRAVNGTEINEAFRH